MSKMKLLQSFFMSVLLLISIIASGQKDPVIDKIIDLGKKESNFMPDGIYADFNTNKGRFSVTLDYKKAPMTVANFIGLAEGTISNSSYPFGTPFFKGSIWHRVVKGHVIQGGEPSIVKDPANFEGSSTGYEIPNEISDLSHNKAGMIGMANDGPNTNTCEYYITLGDRSYLDGNYTLFGEVTDGMDIVNKIEQGDTTFSITIIRSGPEAEKFIVDDETFKNLLDNQWKKVNSEMELKKSETRKFISMNYSGLIILPDSMKYKILVQGKGNAPLYGSIADVMYKGRLVSGLSFVSSAEGGNPVPGSKPIVFSHVIGNDGLIKGIDEALKEMKSGETRLLVIPPELGYGIKSAYYGKEIKGQKRFVISPGETLILEVSLIEFK
jgi:cyclophilin family peptidyl-prolyl cis-trans isomerase